jgi:SAM-dependent methyltransferase
VRTTILALVRRLAPLPEPIVEFGARRYHPRRSTAAQTLQQPVLGCDLSPGLGVDRLADLHAIDMPDESFGTALLLDTIEHVARPWRALQEVARVLRPGGVVVMTSHFYFPIHGYPDDYWRFTGSGFRELLAPFETMAVATAGLAVVPHTAVGVGMRAPRDPALMARLTAAMQHWVRWEATTWKERMLSVLPPVLVGSAYAALQRVTRR